MEHVLAKSKQWLSIAFGSKINNVLTFPVNWGFDFINQIRIYYCRVWKTLIILVVPSLIVFFHHVKRMRLVGDIPKYKILFLWQRQSSFIGFIFNALKTEEQWYWNCIYPIHFFNLVLLQSSSGMKSILLFYCGIPKLNWKDEEKSGEMRLTLKNTIIQILQLTEH